MKGEKWLWRARKTEEGIDESTDRNQFHEEGRKSLGYAKRPEAEKASPLRKLKGFQKRKRFSREKPATELELGKRERSKYRRGKL